LAEGGDDVRPVTTTEPPRQQRPPVSASAGVLAGCAGIFGLIGLGCIGVSAATADAVLSQVEGVQEQRLLELERRQRSLAQADALLDEVAQWLHAAHAQSRGFPRALRENPPPDPWGNSLRYTSAGRDRAELRSAGPDGEFDTPDDLVRTLAAR